jgi:hypothetical protein
MVTKPEASSSKGKAKLVERITTPPFEDRDVSREPPVSLGDSQEDPYAWDESDDSDGAPRRVGPLYYRMDIDDDIADAAGLPANGKGKQKERQVSLTRNQHLLTTLQCTRGSTSAQAKEEPLGSD